MAVQKSVNFSDYLQDANYYHNARVLEKLQPGDLVEFDRHLYNHWAVYVGNEEVVHLTGDIFSSSAQTADPKVKLDNFWDVANGSKATKNNEKDEKCRPLRSWQIVERAKEMVGKCASYSIFSGNCEHFASYCRYGEKYSEQAENLLTGLLVGGAAVVVGGVVGGLLAAAFGGNRDKKS